MNDPYSPLRFSFEVEHSKQIKVDHKLSQSVVLRADRKKSLDLSVGKIKVTFLIFRRKYIEYFTRYLFT